MMREVETVSFYSIWCCWKR